VDNVFKTGIGEMVQAMPPGAVLAYLVFVMPLSETLFFRGLMQQSRTVWVVGGLSSLWSILLFVPMMDISRFPMVAVIISVVLVVVNLVYSYVYQRSGLAAAWVCQIVVNLVLLFLPYFAL
jgi:membrane protease YdiL (CAAX protease family)